MLPAMRSTKTSPVLAAVGQLQFDVFADRLDIEFNAPIELSSAPYQAIRLTDAESAATLREKPGVRILARLDGHSKELERSS